MIRHYLSCDRCDQAMDLDSEAEMKPIHIAQVTLHLCPQCQRDLGIQNSDQFLDMDGHYNGVELLQYLLRHDCKSHPRDDASQLELRKVVDQIKTYLLFANQYKEEASSAARTVSRAYFEGQAFALNTTLDLLQHMDFRTPDAAKGDKPCQE